MMQQTFIGLALAGVLAAPATALAQGARSSRAAAAARAAAGVRTVRGSLRGNVIAVRSNADRPLFDYVLAAARLVDGKLELVGTVRGAGRAGTRGAAVDSTLVGTLAMEPSPEYYEGRARRMRAQRGSPPPAAGQPSEQKQGGPATSTETTGQIGQLSQATQSTARTTQTPVAPEGEQPKPGRNPVVTAAATGITGCEVMYLRLDLPAPYATAAGGRAIQLNVSLAQIDNKAGVDINRRICRVVNALEYGEGSADAEVAELNRLLGAAR